MSRYALFLLCTLPLAAQVEIHKEKDQIRIDIDGKPFTTLFYGEETRKPYLHPLRSADGKVVTRGYPMETIAGESKDHPHHRGVWFTHDGVNGSPFWLSDPMAREQTNARISVTSIDQAEGGKDKGVVAFTAAWVGNDGKTVLTEKRTMTFYATPGRRIVDFDIQLKAGSEAVTFADTKEGTFAIRLADSMIERKGGHMVNAEGAEGEKNVWGKPSPWVDYHGMVDGEHVGVAILDHPSNPGYPTHWHSRAYGLFAANIFGLHDFYNDKTKDGSRTIQPGGAMRFRYRVVIHPGGPAEGKIAEEAKKFQALK